MRRVLSALALLLAACVGEHPAALDPGEGGAPEMAAAQAGVAGVGARFDPARFVFYTLRYYEDAGEVLECQAVPPPDPPVSDFVRTFPNGDTQVHMNGTDAYVLVSGAPAALDEGGRLVPPVPDYEARWAGRGRLSVSTWLGPSGLYSINGLVDAVVGPAADVGIPHGQVDDVVATHAAAFDAAAEGASELRRVRCRLHWTTFVGKVHSNEITLEPLPGKPKGKGGS